MPNNIICVALLTLLMLIYGRPYAQIKDSIATGYLPDAAEEYWPSHNDAGKRDLSSGINHIPIRNGKGFISTGGYFREGYDLFDNYLWGRGPDDNSGYLLHRAIVHADLRYSKNLRFFGQAQSSFISGRLGGPRPVQDLNKLAFDQIFAEYSIQRGARNFIRLRAGKQALHYGAGTLLDIRETNVRRSFVGLKFIAEFRSLKIDLFAMEPMKGNAGFFDDTPDHSQKIAGVWIRQKLGGKLCKQVDAYYIYVHRDSTHFVQGSAADSRHTVGTALNFSNRGFAGYSEADIQIGTFGKSSITAWKLTQTVSYQFSKFPLKPVLFVQSALSSGDHNLQDSSLQTFNPLYPKALYYGYIDNVGASNMFVLLARLELYPFPTLKVMGEYYNFWRQSTVDGLYAPGGALLFGSNNDQRKVGSMVDVVVLYTPDSHFTLRSVLCYYGRGPFLKLQGAHIKDIRYAGIMATWRI
jgi:hypothetical protein